jgi:hypothetical protein
MVALGFVQDHLRIHWRVPKILRAKRNDSVAVSRRAVRWTLAAAALGLIHGDAAQAGLLTDAKLTLHVWELPAAEFPAKAAAGVSVSDTEFYVDPGAEFNSATTVINASTTLYASGLHLHLYDALAGAFMGATRSTVAGTMRVDGDWGPGSQTIWWPWMILGTPTTVDTPNDNGWSIMANGWTVGQAVISGVTTLTPSGALNTDGTATYTGSNGLTPLGAGTIQMVSPTVFHTSDYWYEPTTVPGFAVLELTYVPEPAPLVTLLSGSLLLMLIARRKTRGVARGSERGDARANRPLPLRPSASP